MTKNTNPAEDIQAASRLAIDGIKGVVDIVEAMHYTITRLGGVFGNTEQKRTSGISGFVYKMIRKIIGIAGFGLDALLGKLSSVLQEKEASPGREAALSALNGVLGDYLENKNNVLAIKMRLRVNGKPIVQEKQFSAQTTEQANGKLLLMIHGSSMNDLQWDHQGHNHAKALTKDFGYLPVYLHYNTGLHISENGKKLASLLEVFTKKSPQTIKLTILAHSMGGLVARSACFYGQQAEHVWLNSLKKIVFLGTPHHGAPLEKAGNWIDNILEISPYSKPFSRLGKIRSAGITDLRYGNLIDDDWSGRGRFEASGDLRKPVPLPNNVRCYTIAATISAEPNNLGDNLVGDGLVPLASALGQHKKPEMNLAFPKKHTMIARNIKHLDLLNAPDVYAMIKRWLSE